MCNYVEIRRSVIPNVRIATQISHTSSMVPPKWDATTCVAVSYPDTVVLHHNLEYIDYIEDTVTVIGCSLGTLP